MQVETDEDGMVYAISSGSYSDYAVNYICATRQLAEETAALLNTDDYSDYFVETIDVITEVPVRQEMVTIHTRVNDDGTWEQSSEFSYTHWSFGSPGPAVAWNWTRNREGGNLVVHGSDRERVRRVTSDRGAQLLAEDAFRLRDHAEG